MNLEKEAGLREILKSLLQSTKDLKDLPEYIKLQKEENRGAGLKGLKALKNYGWIAGNTAKGLVIPAAGAAAVGGSIYGYNHLNGNEKKAAYTSKSDDKNKKYPVSRVLYGLNALKDLGLSQAIGYRALLGRAAKGRKGLTPNEKYLLSHLNRDQGGNTYPISRLITTPITGGVLAGLGASSGVYALSKNPKAALGAGIVGAALGAGSTALNRTLFARAVKGRHSDESKGILPSAKNVFDQLRSNNA
jgi:hypothetical protein